MSLEIGIDEFSLVLQSNEQISSYDWSDTAQRMIHRFCEKSKLFELLGELSPVSTKIPSGYDRAYVISPAFGYLAFAYHSFFSTQGVLIRFSATALMYYKNRYKEFYQSDIHVFELLQETLSTSYSCRLSRVDIAVDYFDVDDDLYSPTVIYNDLIKGVTKIVDRNNRCAKRKISARIDGNSINTLYCGSKAEKSPLVVRYYDKKVQQLSTFGCQCDRALRCKNWYRLELSFRHKLAHQIGDFLMLEVHSPQEFSAYLAQCVLDKIRFVTKKNEYLPLTESLLTTAENCEIISLSSSVPQDHSLKKSLSYIVGQSGLFSLLYRVSSIWGEQSVPELLQFLFRVYQESFVPSAPKNQRIISWLKHHKDSLKDTPLSDLLNYSSVPIEPNLKKPKTEIDLSSCFTLTPIYPITEETDVPKENLVPSEKMIDEDFKRFMEDF